jgi:Protein of unknown function (DUF1475)
MNNKSILRLVFGFILVSLTAYNLWASVQQPVWQWAGLTTPPDNWWTIATFIDAYYGFVTFYIWVLYKERRFRSRIIWFVAIMTLGNIAMSAYVLLQLARLRADEPAAAILSARR